MKVRYLLITLLASSAQLVTCHKCPSFIPSPSNGTTPPLGDTITALWSGLTPRLSPLGLSLRNTVQTMWQSGFPTWQTYLLLSTLIGVFLADSNSLAPACFYAKVVNGSDVLFRTGDGSELVAAINSFYTPATSMTYESFINVAKRVGCGSGVKDYVAGPEMDVCSGNPAEYRIKQIWERDGGLFPCQLQETVQKLYSSKNPIDRDLALAFSSALDGRLNSFAAVFDNNVFSGMMALLTTSSVPKSCCQEFVEAGKRQFLTAVRRELSKILRTMAASIPVKAKPCPPPPSKTLSSKPSA